MKHTTISSRQASVGLWGDTCGGCTWAHPGKRYSPPLPTYLCVASVRTTEDSSCPSLADTCMTYCGQLLAGPPRLPSGRVLLLGAGGRRRSGGTPGKWLQRLILMAVGIRSPSKKKGGQGSGVGRKGMFLPVCNSVTLTHREETSFLPQPSKTHSTEREHLQRATEKQSVRLRNSKPRLCAAFVLRKFLKSQEINRKTELSCLSPSKCCKGIYSLHLAHFLKVVPVYQWGKLCIGGESG